MKCQSPPIPDQLTWLIFHPYTPANTLVSLRDPHDAERRLRAELLSVLRQEGVRHCAACGCIEEYACHGGCSWSEEKPELCTRCAIT